MMSSTPVSHSLLLSFCLATVPIAAQTTRISTDSTGTQANGATTADVTIAGQGSFAAFASNATNLVAGDTNGTGDIFVKDLTTGVITRVSVSSVGAQADQNSLAPALTPDGRYVAFASNATNLVAGDTNAATDVFVHDRQAGTTARVSLTAAGAQANRSSQLPSISADGRYVAFESDAENLVAGDTNRSTDVFVRDLQANTTVRVSVSSAGAQGNFGSFRPVMSSDGRAIAFHSDASTLVSGDTNARSDVFVRDQLAGTTVRASVAHSTSAQATNDSYDAAINADGNKVAFFSYATNLVSGDTNGRTDIFLRDLVASTTLRVSLSTAGVQANADCFTPAISADGATVAFQSQASTLVPGDTNFATDIFVADVLRNRTERVSVSTLGGEANGRSIGNAISADGSKIVFTCAATNLVTGDTNRVDDAFLHARCLGSCAAFGTGWPGTTGIPTLACGGTPTLGQTLTLNVGNALGADTPAAVFAGTVQASLPTPFGGTLWVQPLATLAFTLLAAGTPLGIPIPNDPTLCNNPIHLQTVHVDAGASVGVAFTAGLTVVVGQ